MSGSLGEFGAGVLHIIILAAIGFGSLGLGAMAAGRILPDTASENKGCLLSFVFSAAIFIAALLLFGDALKVLQSYSCRSADDFELCMDPPERDWL